jgi:hypothetical protein
MTTPLTYTFLDQQALLSILLGDPNTTSDDMFPSAIRKQYINRGELHFAVDSKCLRNYATGAVSNQELSLPTDWLENHVLMLNNRDITKFEIALQELERYQYAGEFYWYNWQVSGTEKLSFVASNANGGTYRLWYFAKPVNILDQDADVSPFPIEYREASVYWAGWQLMQQIGKTDLANQYMQVYSSFVNSAQSDIQKHYMNRPNPNVDVGDNIADSSAVDIQGKGFTY